MDYWHKPPRRGVNFGRRSGVNIQRRLTRREKDRQLTALLTDQREREQPAPQAPGLFARLFSKRDLIRLF